MARAIDPHQASIAAATANTPMRIGGSIGVAVLNTVAIEATRGYAGTPTEALVHGFATATAGAGVLLLAAAAVVAATMKPSTPDQTHTHPTGADR